MKKTYMIPQVFIVCVAPQRILIGSNTLNLGETATNPDDFEVKSSTTSYSVWSDDWSAE